MSGKDDPINDDSDTLINNSFEDQDIHDDHDNDADDDDDVEDADNDIVCVTIVFRLEL